ncbi:hypothetical protein FXN65_10875 [Metapseudomonas lalkuanensis]|uniref:Uncharacterized protein n=1 Tax=Metapseudomonas lalkuanensis TaxID=2604832 RepID=A0A5J6QJG9_9GAMM|nr:hypothetical protein [Pseudomonas lalkuanensis]QEY62553.1 hypothetical protein FXN65_10875 [Pseudomonas lalkuanensis]
MINIGGVLTDKVNIWGWPWHGRIDADGLHLPNGSTKTHPLPERPWNTYRLRVPGTPVVTRTPEQLADDAAAGRQWWSEAILCGRFFQLYGKDMGGWIYCAPDGSRWLIRRDLAKAIRFGEIGQPSDDRTLTISNPTDNGQSTPAVDLGDGPVTALQWEEPVDITPDGRKAIFMLYTSDPGYPPRERPIPLGFLLAEVTGGLGTAFTMNITVLRTRAQTLGTLGYTNTMVIEPRSMSFNDGTLNYEIATGETIRTLTGRIWAMWFDDTGTPQELCLDIHERVAQEFPEYSPPTGSSPNQYTERTCSKTTDYRYTLRLGATECVTALLTYNEAGTMSSDDDDTMTVTLSLDGTPYHTTVITEINTDPMTISPVPPAWAEGGVEQAVVRAESVSGGSAMDLLPYGNNLVGLYLRLDMAGPDRHRYLAAASPQGAVAINTTVDLTQSGPLQPRFELYGPRPYGAWNPSTHDHAAPEAAPVGWS